MMDGARQAAAVERPSAIGIVISGRSPLDREIDEIAGAVRAIKQDFPFRFAVHWA